MGSGIDIILPCYNPISGWADTVIESVEKLRSALPDVPIRIILVNDGSSAGVALEDIDRLRKAVPAFKYISYTQNRGKGYALREGTAAAENELQIFTDIDFPYEEDSLIKLYHELKEGKADIVAGIRDAEYYKGVPEGRKRISKFLRWLLRTFLNLEITDTQCGLKGFNAKGKALFLTTRINRFLFDMEYIFLASNNKGVSLKGCQVRLKPGIVFSKVQWGILAQEGLNFLSILFRHLFRRRSK